MNENIDKEKPYFATIDGVKKGPFSAVELSKIYQTGGFKNILLFENVISSKEQMYNDFLKNNRDAIINLYNDGLAPVEIAEIYDLTIQQVELILEIN